MASHLSLISFVIACSAEVCCAVRSEVRGQGVTYCKTASPAELQYSSLVKMLYNILIKLN